MGFDSTWLRRGAVTLLVLVGGLTASLAVGATSASAAVANGSVVGDITTERVSTSGNTSQRDLVVYLVPKKAQPISAPKDAVQVTQKQLSFDPHVLVVVPGTKVVFSNEDPISHNVQTKSACCSVDKDMDKGEKLEQVFDKPGIAEIMCRIHPEMLMYVVVLDTPHFASVKIAKEEVDGKGVYRAKYSIPDVPPGEYVLKTWNKKLQPLELPITVAAGAETKLDLDVKK